MSGLITISGKQDLLGMTNVFDRIAERSKKLNSFVCVGLDPQYSQHKDVYEAAYAMYRVVEATKAEAVAYKINLAYWEQYGPTGLDEMNLLRKFIGTDIPVIGDAKRSDIYETAEAYARALFGYYNFDAVTVNAYQGFDSIEPYLSGKGYEDKGVYVVVLTTNPTYSAIQKLNVNDGYSDNFVYEHVIRHIFKKGYFLDRIGFVVRPETYPIWTVRSLVPNCPLLIPGIGAQGGNGALALDVSEKDGRAILTASRSICYAQDPLAALQEINESV